MQGYRNLVVKNRIHAIWSRKKCFDAFNNSVYVYIIFIPAVFYRTFFFCLTFFLLFILEKNVEKQNYAKYNFVILKILYRIWCKNTYMQLQKIIFMSSITMKILKAEYVGIMKKLVHIVECKEIKISMIGSHN